MDGGSKDKNAKINNKCVIKKNLDLKIIKTG